jgi:hypothetical protein
MCVRVILYCLILAAVADARDNVSEIEIRPATAKKYGVRVESAEINPGIVQVIVRSERIRANAGLVINDSNGHFVASVSLGDATGECSVIVQKAYLSHSYVAIPYVSKPEEQVFKVFLADAHESSNQSLQPTAGRRTASL